MNLFYDVYKPGVSSHVKGEFAGEFHRNLDHRLADSECWNIDLLASISKAFRIIV